MNTTLMREVRFALCDPLGPVTNSWAGWPGTTRITPFLSVRAVLCGQADPVSGYLCNIQHLDKVVRHQVIPLLNRTCSTQVADGAQLASACFDVVQKHVPEGAALKRIELHINPYLGFAKHAGDGAMVSVTQGFEFSASHRLYCEQFTEEQNRQTFGKCANPNGHGHNYQLEVTIAGEPDHSSGTVIELPKFESTVRERVIDRFDHKHLNLDCTEFKERNPSVENIAAVIWQLLDGQFMPARLIKVRVWETPKTWAEVDNG